MNLGFLDEEEEEPKGETTDTMIEAFSAEPVTTDPIAILELTLASPSLATKPIPAEATAKVEPAFITTNLSEEVEN